MQDDANGPVCGQSCSILNRKIQDEIPDCGSRSNLVYTAAPSVYGI